jgi:hypothetical protein
VGANRLPCIVTSGVARFSELPLPPAAAPGVADGPALAFVRACDLVAAPGGPGDCLVHGARHDGRVQHLLVSARCLVLDAAPASGWDMPRRGEACTLAIRVARVLSAREAVPHHRAVPAAA